MTAAKPSKQGPTTGHTPGPWTAWDDDGTGTLPCVLSKGVTAFGNFYVAQCNVFEDARLIAAAPELAELLRQLNRDHPAILSGQCRICLHYGEDCYGSKARAALQKAGLL